MHHHALVLVALCCWTPFALAYDATSSRATDLSGTWKLNTGSSDDAQQMLDERLERERRQRAQWRRHQESMRPPGAPPSLESSQEQAGPGRRRPWQQRRYENLRKMLAIGDTLTIRQTGTSVEIVSELEARRVEAGSRTQVSMPAGELADSSVGWDGEWFVIERAVRKGPRVVEKYRIVKKTGQLEYRMAWSGDTELAGLKVTRYFERVTGASAAPDPAAVGPVR
jgi:hypothetical protein